MARCISPLCELNGCMFPQACPIASDEPPTTPTPLNADDAIVRDVIKDVLDALVCCTLSLQSYVEASPPESRLIYFDSADVGAIERELASAIERLSAEPVTRFTQAVHQRAIEAAARFCDGRSRSLLTDSQNPNAATEASKCAFGIRRLSTLAALALRPELTQEGSHE